MIKMGALVVDVTGAGGVSECPNHALQGALPQDIAMAISGTRASVDHSDAARRRPLMPGVGG